MKGTGIKIGCLLAFLMAGVAMAQIPLKQMAVGRKVFLAMRPDVQTELKLTAAQKDKLSKAMGGSVAQEGGKVRVSIGPGSDLDDMEKNAMAVLTTAQRTRLEQIWVQRNGALSGLDSDIAAKLGLSKDQVAKLDDIAEDMMQELMGGSGHGGQIRIEDKGGEKRKAAMRRAEKVLTADQKKKLDNLKGAPFAWKD